VEADQVGGQLVGLAGGGAVADGDQLHGVGAGQAGEPVDRLVPLAAGLVGVDRVGGHGLAGAVDDRHLDARPQPGVEAHRGAGTGRGGQQ
jgi:hypothetical protein